MDDPFYLEINSPRLMPDQWVIKAGSYTEPLKLNELQHNAQQNIDRLLAEAKLVFDTREQEGYEAGLQQAKEEIANQLTRISGQTAAFLISIEDQVIDTVVAAVQLILDRTDQDEVIRAQAATAVRSARDIKQMTLKVCPEQIAVVEQFITELHNESSVESIEIAAEKDLKYGSCILETPIGIIDASLDTQLRMIKDCLQSEFQKEKATE